LSIAASVSCANAPVVKRKTAITMTKRRMRGILVGHAYCFGVAPAAHAFLRELCGLRKAGAGHALLRDAETGRRLGQRCGVAAVPGGRDHVTFSVGPDDVGGIRSVARSAQCDRARADAYRADRAWAGG